LIATLPMIFIQMKSVFRTMKRSLNMTENDGNQEKNRIEKLVYDEKKAKHWWEYIVGEKPQKPLWATVIEIVELSILYIIGLIVLVIGGCLIFSVLNNHGHL
jgi:hypothetical protein